jgi:hypothetical protein
MLAGTGQNYKLIAEMIPKCQKCINKQGCEMCWIDGGWSIRTEFLRVKNVISEMTNLWNCIMVISRDEFPDQWHVEGVWMWMEGGQRKNNRKINNYAISQIDHFWNYIFNPQEFSSNTSSPVNSTHFATLLCSSFCFAPPAMLHLGAPAVLLFLEPLLCSSWLDDIVIYLK